MPIKYTSDPRKRRNARNQRSASNPVLSRSHKHHLNENIHGHLQRGESDEGVHAHLDIITLFSIKATMRSDLQATPRRAMKKTQGMHIFKWAH